MGLNSDELHSHADLLRSWSDRVPDQGALAGIVSYLDNLGSTLRGHAHMTPRQKALQDIGQALLTTHIKSQEEMNFVAEKSLKVFFPGTPEKLSMRHRTVSSRNAFLVDLAYMLLTRDRSCKECRVEFGWGDSSPQGGFDFLLLKYRYLPVKQLLQAAAALRKLIKTRGGSLGGGFDADDEVSLETVRARAAANLVLWKSVLEHLCVPVCHECLSLRLLLRFGCCCCCCSCMFGRFVCRFGWRCSVWRCFRWVSAGVAPIGSAVAVAVAAAAPFGVASDGCRCGGAVASWLCWFWCWFWSCLGGVLESLFGAGVFLGGCCGVATFYYLCTPPPKTKQNLGTEHDGPGPHRCRGQSQQPLAHA